MKRSIARLQTTWLRLFALIVVATVALNVPWIAGLVLVAIPLLLSLVRPPRTTREPVVIDPPVRGRWTALNSPASAVPSHRTHGYAQTYAIDVAQPLAGDRLGWGLGLRAPESSTCFGAPVTAMADGTVVAVASRQRDHLTRSSWPSILYLMVVEAFARELGGARFLLGNHVVIDHGDHFSVSAHLRRGSVAVAVGDHVRAGDQIGAVGNSGNSTQPHLHVQLMDRAKPTAAAGVPFAWRTIEVVACGAGDDVAATGSIAPTLPANGQEFVVRSEASPEDVAVEKIRVFATTGPAAHR